MNQVNFDLLDSCIVIYLEDILVFNCTKEDHVHDLNAIFLKLVESIALCQGIKVCDIFEKG